MNEAKYTLFDLLLTFSVFAVEPRLFGLAGTKGKTDNRKSG